MKSKNITIFKTVLTIVGFCLFLFGLMGFAMDYGTSIGKTEIEKYYKQQPLNEKNGIAVDSNGNIYVGDGQTGSIQVYDNIGNFQYGFSFPTGGSGWFEFGIEQDKIHIVTARTESYFIFDRGELVYSEKGIKYDRSEKLQAQYNMKNDSSYIANNKIYKISSLNNVSINDKVSGKLENIYLNAPIWPFPIAVFWGMGAAGIGLILVLHHKLFISMTKEVKSNLRLK